MMMIDDDDDDEDDDLRHKRTNKRTHGEREKRTDVRNRIRCILWF